MKLTENFYLDELIVSDTAIRLGIANNPSPTVIGNLKQLADSLERVRKLLGYPILISSGYRSPSLNRAIGGSFTSAHCLGYAADFNCRKFGSPNEIVKLINDSDIQYDQLIYEGYWVHFSIAPAMRRQTLTAKFNRGKVTYSNYVQIMREG